LERYLEGMTRWLEDMKDRGGGQALLGVIHPYVWGSQGLRI